MNNYKELEDNLKAMIIKEPFSWQKFVERAYRDWETYIIHPNLFFHWG